MVVQGMLLKSLLHVIISILTLAKVNVCHGMVTSLDKRLARTETDISRMP